MSTNEKKIILKPSHKSLLWWYLLAVLLIPVFGIGIYLLYRFYTTHQSISYIITDHRITLKDSSVTENIDLASIVETGVFRGLNEKITGTGNVVIKTKARTATLIGQEEPGQLAELIRRAAEAERRRIEEKPEKKEKAASQNPGTLDKRDYLTGLWQQGLLSDEDFKKEMKHFQ
ncbi:hypothetical protein [Rhodohalobacter mucosus]|uniref:PH domain-containing protein n=1 Tax=Rhodohalobacter mucosus TaxID=2079485 RepID=A0A316TSP0_9BACT|nr:hypothetical protein [Rhodohalobacter mucosus]PWN06661.1 hypothetical protein DDZ15_09095 [Rhodohalobacter mucosus]